MLLSSFKARPLHAARQFVDFSLRIIMAPRFRFTTNTSSVYVSFTQKLLFHPRVFTFSFFFLLNHDSRFHFIYELYKRNFYQGLLFFSFPCLFDKSGLNELTMEQINVVTFKERFVSNRYYYHSPFYSIDRARNFLNCIPSQFRNFKYLTQFFANANTLTCA